MQFGTGFWFFSPDSLFIRGLKYPLIGNWGFLEEIRSRQVIEDLQTDSNCEFSFRIGGEYICKWNVYKWYIYTSTVESHYAGSFCGIRAHLDLRVSVL
jgi:hypothetical protein